MEHSFETYLISRNLSHNTVISYLYGVRQFFSLPKELTEDSLGLYKVYLLEHYKPQTVNSRIRALNCYLKFLGRDDIVLHCLRLQKKSYLEHVISQADYEYLKRRLWEDEEFTFYFIVRFMAATGVRVSELVTFQISDVTAGFKDIFSKGDKMRRIYIPACLQEKTRSWLALEGRAAGPLFLSHLGTAISVSGIRTQLKAYAARYQLNPQVVYPHSFRHRFAKSFIEGGGDIALLSHLLGHGSIETTRIYLRRTSTEQAQILNQVVNW